MRRRTFSLLFLASIAACGGRRDSTANEPSSIPLGQQPVSITLESPGRGTLPSGVLGNSLYYAGQEGEQYIVRLTNNTADRLELVVTVDGRDVVSGEIGDYVKQRGYIVEPFGSIVVDGFRQSHDRVAAFRFAGLESSYTALRGTPQNAGVIGVAVFEEKPGNKKKTGPLAQGPQAFPGQDDDASASTSTPPVQPQPEPFQNRGRGVAAKDSAAEAAPSSAPMEAEEGGALSADATAPSSTARRDAGGDGFAPPPVPKNELGTQYGESQFSAVHEVEFKRKKKRKPDAIIAVFYDSERGLQARGVPIGGAFVQDPNAPQPFPQR